MYSSMTVYLAPEDGKDGKKKKKEKGAASDSEAEESATKDKKKKKDSIGKLNFSQINLNLVA